MSEQVDELGLEAELDGVLADPARLLDADRAALRARIEEASPGVGREVFLQAEAMFGVADVPRAEFAAWLHFAAVATGESSYAELVAAAEPGMPWRTVWAWWRPVNWFVAQPSLNGDYYRVRRLLHDGRDVLEVADQRGPVRFETETGDRVQIPADAEPEEGAPRLWDAPQLRDWALNAPWNWSEADVLSVEGHKSRHLVTGEHGVAVLETDARTLHDWPRGKVDPSSSDAAEGLALPTRRQIEGPLTAARVDESFGAKWARRIPAEDLPEALQHPASRAHLTGIGLPAWWSCAFDEYETYTPDAMKPAVGDGLPEDLIALGSCTYGEVYLHGAEGTVHVHGNSDGPSNGELVTLAPDLDVFTRALEAVYRYSNACWHPYPAEGDQDDVTLVFLDELNELAPGLFDKGTPSGELWSWIYAGITELGVDGY
ncbi:SUKH-4 family immunity protein [Streptomyces sp. LHD-70]|uniref:SUKH-4 family immunity protein n=1 Tax=Streptomyces sp. LHD-70 TaxID=3072140 RepID=UPI00280F3D5C|nr:SUKH-4 family immunity protein [Streptomyces sp. LHD-70]MDQ8702005.1 SUKH-4 family immunity protein [Streptomyces sp. LHD-70]